VVLKGHFRISTQELCDAVVEAEKVTKTGGRTKAKTKGREILYDSEIEEVIEGEVQDESESDTEDCIIVANTVGKQHFTSLYSPAREKGIYKEKYHRRMGCEWFVSIQPR
jgi:hypothetical protein